VTRDVSRRRPVLVQEEIFILHEEILFLQEERGPRAGGVFHPADGAGPSCRRKASSRGRSEVVVQGEIASRRRAGVEQRLAPWP
jgi:hypothetical protein